MADLKSVFYTSVGLVLKGKKKVEKAARQFVEDNKIEAAEGKKLIDKAVKYVEDAKEELSKKISETVKTTINKMGLITHKEVAELKNEIKNLKTQMHKSTNTKSTKQKIKKSQKK
ncbi:hypothetical protein AGMMS50222_02400 [Endomicrobiia bacterium]|nr:hypothetical protein AGMMS49531_08090 [Endomicrobiia bacterium]GHT73993.1 hypothetical protein AGMMS50222_02400 [Endomicrobiia bacterium]